MPTISAGLLLYRGTPAGPEVLLGHMGGPFWAGKEAGAWSIFKGLPLPGEDLLAAARRETREETGLALDGPFLPADPGPPGRGKRARPGPRPTTPTPPSYAATSSRANGHHARASWRSFPEIDRFAWLDLPEAQRRIIPPRRHC